MTGDATSGTGIPGAYDQYKNPTDAAGRSQGYAWWQGAPIGVLGPVTNMLGGDRYVDEGDPSWEDVITMVVIPGEPGHIRSAAGVWEVVFSRVEQAKTLLDDGIGDLRSWEGDAGTAYREHLTGVSKEIGTLIDDHRPVITSLQTAADNLESAIAKIPIPDDMAHEVKAAKNGFINSGNVAGLGPDAIYQTLMPIFSNKWVDELRETFSWDWAEKNLRDWISSQDDEAKAAYRALAGQHVTTMDGMPEGAVLSTREPKPTTVDTSSPSTPKVPGSVPDTGASDLSSKGYTPDTSIPDTGTGTDVPTSGTTNPFDTDNPGTGDFSGTGSGTDPELGSGLAGAGGGGLTGAGGLGSGASGLGSGASGLGAGGGAAGLGGLTGAGTGSGLGAGAAGLGGLAGSGLGAGALGKGVAGGVGVGGAGRGGQGAGDGDGDEHSTWLNEDDDPWGSDDDLAPPVLGA